MLGLAPSIATFFGLPLDVRHVTLATGQVTAAVATLGFRNIRPVVMLGTAVGILGIGALNVLVSFGLALVVAIRARDFRGPERDQFFRALGMRLFYSPLSFILPVGRNVEAASGIKTMVE